MTRKGKHHFAKIEGLSIEDIYRRTEAAVDRAGYYTQRQHDQLYGAYQALGWMVERNCSPCDWLRKVAAGVCQAHDGGALRASAREQKAEFQTPG